MFETKEIQYYIVPNKLDLFYHLKWRCSLFVVIFQGKFNLIDLYAEKTEITEPVVVPVLTETILQSHSHTSKTYFLS